MAEQWFIDGWELTNYATHQWETRAGTDGITELAGADASIPLADGVRFGARTLAPGQVELSLIALADAYQTMHDVWGEVAKVVSRRRRPVLLERHMGYGGVPGAAQNGEVRQAEAVLTRRVEPTHVGQAAMRATLVFSVLSGVWTTQATYTAVSDVGAADSRSVTVDGLGSSTAPMPALLAIDGPVTDPVITDSTDTAANAVHSTFKYAGSIPDGVTLTVDSANWTVTANGGFTPDPGLLEYSGPTFFEMEHPPPGGDVTVTMDCSGAGAGTQFQVTAPRCYAA